MAVAISKPPKSQHPNQVSWTYVILTYKGKDAGWHTGLLRII
jgi:hypothetical protein